ncbi:MAG: hypothetical protein ACK4WC_13420, partial [Rubrimonas sp.]
MNAVARIAPAPTPTRRIGAFQALLMVVERLDTPLTGGPLKGYFAAADRGQTARHGVQRVHHRPSHRPERHRQRHARPHQRHQ